MKIFFNLILILTALLIISCSKMSTPEKENFINTYKDILTAKEQISDSSQLAEEYKKIYEKYNFTEKTFNSELMRYQKNTDDFLEILDSVKIRITREEAQIEKIRHESEE